MNYAKRTIAGILAAAFVFSAVGCGKDREKEVQEAQKVGDVIKNFYSAVEAGEMPTLNYIDRILPMGDTGNYLITGGDGAGYSCYITDSEFIDYQSVDISSLKDGHDDYSASPITMPDGSVYVIARYTDYEEGTVLPDYEDPDFDWENFDYEALQEAATDSCYLCEIDETGAVLSQNEVTGMDKYIENDDGETGQIYVGSAYALGNDAILCSVSGMYEESHVAMGVDGKAIGKVDLGDDVYLYDNCFNDKDGNLIFTAYDENYDRVIKKLDAETMTVSDDEIPLKDVDSYVSGLYRGNDTYPMLVAGSSSLYGITADNEIEEILNWIDADLSGDSVRGIFPVENDEFMLYIDDWQSDSKGFYRLTKRDPSEIANATIINLVVNYSDSEIISKVKKFNDENTDYRIRVEEYGKYYEWDDKTEKMTNSPEKQLQSDIAAGKSVDMIYMGDAAMINNLGKKGALVDLYGYMGKDGSPAKEDFVDSVLAGMEMDGKLYALPLSFTVKTYAIKSKFFSEENWTLDDLIEVYNNLPEGCKMYQYSTTKDRVFDDLAMSSSQFIDIKNGTCSFDSPEFIKILEFADRFDNDGEGENINWETMSQEEEQAYYEEQELAYRKDKALVYDMWLNDPREYKRVKDGVFGEDITLVGVPSSDGSGAQLQIYNSFSIMSASPSKDACWEFINQFLTGEDDDKAGYKYELSVLKSSFEKKLDEAMEKPYWTDEDGKKHEYDDSYYMGGESITIDPLTQEERDYIADYILNAKCSDYYYDSEIYSIINEEVGAFFAGKKSAQDAADIIQDRVSILISEKS